MAIVSLHMVCMWGHWNTFKIFYFQNKDDSLAANAFLEEAEVNIESLFRHLTLLFLQYHISIIKDPEN